MSLFDAQGDKVLKAFEGIQEVCRSFNHESTYIDITAPRMGFWDEHKEHHFWGGMFSLGDWGVLVWHMFDESLGTDE